MLSRTGLINTGRIWAIKALASQPVNQQVTSESLGQIWQKHIKGEMCNCVMK